MKQKRLASFLSLAMSLELMMSPLIPVARAQDDAPARSSSNKPSTAAILNTAITTIGQVYNTVTQNGNNNPLMQQMNSDMAQLQSQQTPQPDKFFNLQKLGMIPGLSKYVAQNGINPAMLNCPTLPTTLFEARPEVCRIGVSTDRGVNPQLQTQQMYTYADTYFKIGKLYDNYQADSNSDGQGFGVGCMNNAMNILNGFFKYRIDELDKLTTQIEALNNQFREASRSDLDALEEAVAVLYGDSEIADKVRSKKEDLFNFKKRFDNPACNSMFAGDKLNNIGKDGGLSQINSNMKDILSQKGKNGKYSGESYSKLHTAVIEDINSLADKVSKQFQLNYDAISKDPSNYSKFLSTLPGSVSSSTGSNQALTADLFSDVQTRYNETFIKLNDQKNTVVSELRSAGISADETANLLGSTTSNNFDNEVANIENRIKNKCFESTLSSINKKKILDKIYDPSSSKHANKFASNFLKDKLSQILDDSDTSLDKKLAQLKQLDAQANNRYYINMENSYEVQDVDANGNLTTKVVDAATRRTPSIFFTDLINNCNAQFKANKLNNQMTGAGAIAKLKQLNTEYKNLGKSQAAEMQKEVRKKLIECQSPEVANNTTPGSCTPDRFDTSTPGFCANAAFSCSKNMQACSAQAEKFTEEIKQQKSARTNNYKNLVKKNKQDIVRIFDEKLSQYMKEAESLRGIFGAGFTSPAGVKREVPEGERYLPEFQNAKSPDARLLLEDPDKYVAMFKENINLLKASVKAQQDQILGGESVGKSGGLLADHIKKTKDNYRSVATLAKDIQRDCQGKLDEALLAAKAQQAEQQKKNNELGEQQNDFCRRYNLAVSGHPAAACAGDIEANVTSVSRLPGGSSLAGDFQEYCDGAQNSSESNIELKAAEICYESTPVDPKAAPLNRRISAASTKIDTLTKRIEDQEGRIDGETDAAKKTQLETALTALKGQLTTAENELKTARDELDKLPTPSSEIARACVEFNKCSGPKTSSIDPDTRERVTTETCPDFKLKAAANTVLRIKGEVPKTPSAETAPAFCTAGSNGNRDPLKTFTDTLQQSLATSGTQRQ